MSSRKSIWFHLGHALERTRPSAPAASKAVEGLAERRRVPLERPKPEAGRKTSRTAAEGDRPPLPTTDELMAAGVALVVDRVLGSWGKGREPGISGLLRAAGAGATAALLVDLVRPLLQGDPRLPTLDRDTAQRLIAGAGQGLVYGALIEPRLPGHALVKGALYGSVEYAADPMGGLPGLLGSRTPVRSLPVLGDVLDGLDRHDRAYLEHLAFGIALALLYEPSSSSNGIRPEGE